MARLKLFLKWSFVFSFLIVWSYFVVIGSILGSFSKDFNVPIYIQTSAGIEKASSNDIVDIMFNYGFEVQEKTEAIPMDKCSLRAEGGALKVDGNNLGSYNKLSFTVNNLNEGQGSLIGRVNRERFSASFDIKDVLETSPQKLTLKADGEGKLNSEKLTLANITISFDKNTNKVDIAGENPELEANGLDAVFVDGCSMEEKSFYLILKNEKLQEKRKIGEVREILDSHPELIDMYGGLDRLYSDYWWAILPGGMTIS